MVRTVGVEEELLLIDPVSRQAVPRAPEVLKHAAEHHLPGSDALDHELFRHQLEIRTPPVADVASLYEHVLLTRRTASLAASAAGLVTAACGAVPLRSAPPRTTRNDRYLAMVDTFGEVARPGGTCGMHVHVAVADDEEAVIALDGLAPWLPVLLAMSANSPFYAGHDTGYASWRSHLWAQWPSAGPTERFGSVAAYREVGRRLIASGAALDEGMLYYDARVARNFPTVEIRVPDVCTDPADAVLIAALARALVEHLAAAGRPTVASDVWRAELLRAARWRASRYGLGDRILDPVSGELAPARDVLALLVRTVREPLEAAGDVDIVTEGVARVLADTGSTRQRAAFERSGGSVERVVDDLVQRTNAAGNAVRP
ncbi:MULTISPECIES: glutamate--cysteine ligase [unclassified Nocardioides]|uniref:carboxylate-amine ligase n=1 Tax=unclassified Nocardioides TaxID=2615069 RepID=UPI0007034928|nr:MULTISPECIES: glutamate--cysteine ligase [unclassified Nocardioides]KRC50051.1 carboxylate--amine ligase [Nocardioides sp. Root79]KRC75519.1 carboxylate--amine ligase [Nocardioides sp. Root240]